MIMIRSRQAGLVTVDFIFALVITLSMAALLFAVCFTFSIVEVAQYMAFSSARAFSAAHITPDQQVERGRAHYAELLAHPVLGRMFKNGWFELSPAEEMEIRGGGSSGSFGSEYGDGEGGARMPFTGVRLKFRAKMLDFNVPFLGPTSTQDNDFTANITGFLIREPSQVECQDFMSQRYDQGILNLDPSRFNQSKASTDYREGSYVPIEDNGC